MEIQIPVLLFRSNVNKVNNKLIHFNTSMHLLVNRSLSLSFSLSVSSLKKSYVLLSGMFYTHLYICINFDILFSTLTFFLRGGCGCIEIPMCILIYILMTNISLLFNNFCQRVCIFDVMASQFNICCLLHFCSGAGTHKLTKGQTLGTVFIKEMKQTMFNYSGHSMKMQTHF